MHPGDPCSLGGLVSARPDRSPAAGLLISVLMSRRDELSLSRLDKVKLPNRLHERWTGLLEA